MTGCLFHRKLSQSYKTLQNSIFLGVLYATKLGSFKSHNSHSSTLCFPSSTFDASCDRQIPWTCWQEVRFRAQFKNAKDRMQRMLTLEHLVKVTLSDTKTIGALFQVPSCKTIWLNSKNNCRCCRILKLGNRETAISKHIVWITIISYIDISLTFIDYMIAHLKSELNSMIVCVIYPLACLKRKFRIWMKTEGVLHGHGQEQLAEIQQDGFRGDWEGPEITAKNLQHRNGVRLASCRAQPWRKWCSNNWSRQPRGKCVGGTGWWYLLGALLCIYYEYL